MKLHILLDYSVECKCEKGDIIITSLDSQYTPCVDVIVIPFSYSVVFTDENIINVFNNLFKNTDAFFSSSRNTIYARFYIAIYALLKTVANILKDNPVQSIVLYGGSKVPFVTTINAEGEGQKKNYQTNWLVNSIIFEKYKLLYNIEWYHREASFVWSIKCYLRWLKATSYLICQVLFRSIKEKRNTQPYNSDIISVVDLSLQAKALLNLFAKIGKSISFITLNDSCYETLKNDKLHAYLLPYPGIRDLLNIILNSLFRKVIIEDSCYGKCFDKFFLREVRLQSLIYHIRLKRIEQGLIISKNSINRPVVVTNMTFGSDIVSVHEAAKNQGLMHLNFQYVGSGKLLYPQLNLADCYYLYAKQTYELYKKYSDSYHLYLPISPYRLGNNDSNRKRRLTIFMQPDSFVYDYINYIKNIINNERLLSFGWEIIVKPHYRQNEIESLYAIVGDNPNVRVAEPFDSCGELLKNTDIAMSICSAVIFEAMSNRVMSLVYNPDSKYDKRIYHGDACYPDVNFVINRPEETLNYIMHYSSYEKEFNERLDLFLKINKVEVDLNRLL